MKKKDIKFSLTLWDKAEEGYVGFEFLPDGSGVKVESQGMVCVLAMKTFAFAVELFEGAIEQLRKEGRLKDE